MGKEPRPVLVEKNRTWPSTVLEEGRKRTLRCSVREWGREPGQELVEKKRTWPSTLVEKGRKRTLLSESMSKEPSRSTDAKVRRLRNLSTILFSANFSTKQHPFLILCIRSPGKKGIFLPNVSMHYYCMFIVAFATTYLSNARFNSLCISCAFT